MKIPIETKECSTREFALANAEHLMIMADMENITKVDQGTWLETSEGLMHKQTGWPETDLAKHFDFTAAPYWLTSELGHLIPARNAKDVLDAINHIKAAEAKQARK